MAVDLHRHAAKDSKGQDGTRSPYKGSSVVPSKGFLCFPPCGTNNPCKRCSGHHWLEKDARQCRPSLLEKGSGRGNRKGKGKGSRMVSKQGWEASIDQ